MQKVSSVNPYRASNAVVQASTNARAAANSSKYVGTFHNLVSGIENAVNRIKNDGVVSTVQNSANVYKRALDTALYGSNGASSTPSASTISSALSGGSSYSGSGSSSAVSAKAASTSKSLEQIINDSVDRNNAWAAEQAQKQMDFQERMSRNAHQYEIEDLQKAGLNPILSVTGGNGAQAMSGAMAQPDTSNTRLLAELSMESLGSLGSSAVQLAAASGSKSANTFRDKLIGAATKYFVPALAKGAAAALTRGLF